jgi:hypothetical protein
LIYSAEVAGYVDPGEKPIVLEDALNLILLEPTSMTYIDISLKEI